VSPSIENLTDASVGRGCDATGRCPVPTHSGPSSPSIAMPAHAPLRPLPGGSRRVSAEIYRGFLSCYEATSRPSPRPVGCRVEARSVKPRLLRSGRQIEAAVHRSVASPPSGKVLEFFPFVVIRHFAVSVASESSGLRRAQFSRNGYRLKRFRSDNLKFF